MLPSSILPPAVVGRRMKNLLLLPLCPRRPPPAPQDAARQPCPAAGAKWPGTLQALQCPLGCLPDLVELLSILLAIWRPKSANRFRCPSWQCQPERSLPAGCSPAGQELCPAPQCLQSPPSGALLPRTELCCPSGLLLCLAAAANPSGCCRSYQCWMWSGSSLLCSRGQTRLGQALGKVL